MNYQEIQPYVRRDIIEYQKMLDEENLFALPQTPAHTHNGTDSPQVSFPNLTDRTRYILYRIVQSTTDVATGTKVGGDISMPFGGNVISVAATVDTAGTTNASTLDVNKNGTSILQSDISIASGAKTSRPTYPFIKTKPFLLGDILTIDVDTVSTTAPKGLTVCIKVEETTP